MNEENDYFPFKLYENNKLTPFKSKNDKYSCFI